uniref:Uncharacterized protein n=1 Tax=Fagus sylvatica TaxID=28930 RepID=A0A2N9I9U2_FAGSY
MLASKIDSIVEDLKSVSVNSDDRLPEDRSQYAKHWESVGSKLDQDDEVGLLERPKKHVFYRSSSRTSSLLIFQNKESWLAMQLLTWRCKLWSSTGDANSGLQHPQKKNVGFQDRFDCGRPGISLSELR